MKKLFFTTLFMLVFANTNLFGMEKFAIYLKKFCCCCCETRESRTKVSPVNSNEDILSIEVQPKKMVANQDFKRFFKSKVQRNGTLMLTIADEAISRRHKTAQLKQFLINNIMPLLSQNEIKQIKLSFLRQPIMPELPSLFIHATITTPEAFKMFVTLLPYPVFNSMSWFSKGTIKDLQNNQQITISTNLTKHAARTLSTTSLFDPKSGELYNETKK